MNAHQFAMLASVCYGGNRWQSQIARDLGVSDRTVRRWIAGEAAIPEGIERDIKALALKKMKEMANLLGYPEDAVQPIH